MIRCYLLLHNLKHLVFSSVLSKYFWEMVVKKVKQKFLALIGFFLGILIFRILWKILISYDSKASRVKITCEIKHFYNSDLNNEGTNKAKILCMIMTNPANHRTKAVHVRDTWGKRCDKLLFVTSQDDPELDTFVVDVVESRDALENKTKAMWLHAHDYYLNEFDWFMRADDDK